MCDSKVAVAGLTLTKPRTGWREDHAHSVVAALCHIKSGREPPRDGRRFLYNCTHPCLNGVRREHDAVSTIVYGSEASDCSENDPPPICRIVIAGSAGAITSTCRACAPRTAAQRTSISDNDLS